MQTLKPSVWLQKLNFHACMLVRTTNISLRNKNFPINTKHESEFESYE